MNIPNLNTLISEAFEVKPATSPKFRDISKMSAAKMNLKSLVTGGNTLSTKKEAISPANKSVSTPKFNLDSYQKDYLSPKNNQPIDQQPFSTKAFEGKKQSKKSNSINLASILKQNPSKSTTNKQSNTIVYNSQTADILMSDIKSVTAKNYSTIDQHSPYNKKITIPSKEQRAPSENMTQVQTPKIKHIDLHGYEQANKYSEKTNEAKQPIYCKPKNQPLLENEILIKRVIPKRVKHKEDQAEAALDNKRHFKRKSVYRNRKDSNHTETHDDPTSKLSTKAPSQFSEVRRSFPSQKSHSLIKQTLPDHLEDELKDISSFQHQHQQPPRVRYNTEAKINESHETTAGKYRTQSSSVNKETPPLQPQSKEKVDNNNKPKIHSLKTDLKHLKSMDGATYGKFLKTFYLQKKMDQNKAKSTKAASIHVSILKEDLDLHHPQIHSFKQSYEAEAEEKRAPQPEYKHFAINRFSTPKEETRKRESFHIHDLPSENKLLSVRSQDLKLSKSISTPKSSITENLKNEISSKILSNFLKNNEKKNMNKKKPAIRENKSVQLEDRTAHSLLSKNDTSNQEVTKFDSNISVHFNDKADVLYKMYQKTKNILEGYKARENSWTAEKSNLLEHIQNLEYKLQNYESSKPGL